VKVCCITCEADLQLAVAEGADALGLVGPMPSGTGIITLETARRLNALAPPAVTPFLLSSATLTERMVEEVRYTGVPVLQIVDHAPAGAYARLRQAAPWVRIVQVVHVAGPETVDEVLRVAGRPTRSCSTAAAARGRSPVWAGPGRSTTGR
jgi:phosphoribosylanthranilate isomerase